MKLSDALALASQMAATAAELAAAQQKIQKIAQQAASEGREHFTDDEWAQITSLDDSARQNLDDALARARART